MKKQLFGYSIKEVEAALEVLRAENESLKKKISQSQTELARLKLKVEYVENYSKRTEVPAEETKTSDKNNNIKLVSNK